jgi:hypothetical protein
MGEKQTNGAESGGGGFVFPKPKSKILYFQVLGGFVSSFSYVLKSLQNDCGAPWDATTPS